MKTHARGRTIGRKAARASILALVGVLTALIIYVGPARAQAGNVQASALVLVNSASGRYGDYARYVQPYLENFGVPYTTLDLAFSAVPTNIGDYAVIVIGHPQIDVAGAALSAGEQTLISNAVASGSGLVNFDGDVATAGGSGRYAFVQNVFGFGYGGSTASTAVSVNNAASVGGYIGALQNAGASYTLLSSVSIRNVTLGGDSASVATLGGMPFVVAANAGQGRAVQWLSTDWIQLNTWGPGRGFDDLVWRSLVWAARKPFVMQGLPPFVTFRVDDGSGPYDWAQTATQLGYKVWIGYFLDDQSPQDAAQLQQLVDSGNATVSMHARSQNNWAYWGRTTTWADLPDSVVAQNFADATAFHQQYSLPISKFIVPHYYEIGKNTFSYLRDWGVEYIGTVTPISQFYDTATRLPLGPYSRFEQACGSCTNPVVLADFLTIPEHPEFDGQFFALVTEPRDITGYEWFPDNDVAGSTARGTAYLKRALDGMNLAVLMTHEYFFPSISPANWSAALTNIRNNIAGYQPEYVTMDYAGQYVRAVTTSSITSAVFETTSQQLTASFIGRTDLVTRFYLFTESGGAIQSQFVDVPAFTGSTVVTVGASGPAPTSTATRTPTQTNTAVPGTPTTTSTPTITPTPSNTPVVTPTPIVVNVYEDTHQSPVLATTTDAGALITNDNQWTEFLWVGRGYPGVFWATGETPPVMRFYATVPNGTYTFAANLYWNQNLRYYWGTTAGNPTQFSVDVTNGTAGSFSEYTLGTVTVTNGVFEIYVQRADGLGGGSTYPFAGWAWVRLTP